MSDTGSSLAKNISDAHAYYRADRRTYRKPDLFADDTVTSGIIKEHAARALFSGAVVFVISMVLFAISFMSTLGAAIGASSGESSGDAMAAGGLAFFFLIVAGLLWLSWFVLLFLPMREGVAEYSLLIEGRAAANEGAYWAITRAFGGRQSPFHLQFCQQAGEFMVHLSNTQRDEAMITVKPYGQDLYVGWTMWRKRSTVVLVWHLVRDRFRLFGGGTHFRSAMRGSDTRALREVTHSVTREGVLFAIHNLQLRPEHREEIRRTPPLGAYTGDAAQPAV